MAKKLKDLGGKKWEKYPSIKAAQEAGSIYYSKGGKKMAAVFKTDLGKGQSLRSFMNEQLKLKRKTRSQPRLGVIDPKGQDVGKDYETYPEKIAGISRSDMLKIIDSSKNPVKVKTSPSKNIKNTLDRRIGKLTSAVKKAKSPAEVRQLFKDMNISVTKSKLEPLLKQLELKGNFNFKPAKPKPSPKVEKPKTKNVQLESFVSKKPKPKNVQPESFVSKKPNRTTTQRRKMSNAAVVKLFKEMYPSRLAKIKIGDIVYFDPNRTNPQGNPAIVMISSKGK